MLPAPKARADISAELDLFSIRTVSVLLDDTTDHEMIRAIPSVDVKGYYTFTSAIAGRNICGHKVQLLPLVSDMPESQAWLIATNSKASYALNEFLRDRGQEEKIIFTLAQAYVSRMYSYVDFFHGETTTAAYISNTLERGYKIHLPIAVRYLLRSQTGEVHKSGQWLIAPNQTVAFDSRTIGLEIPFLGYLEIYADIRHLNGQVSEFFHFHCDYFSTAGIATIHQSGFKPWPAGTRFIRGIVPTNNQEQLTVSLFNKKSDKPIVCTAILRHTKKGQRLTITKELPAIAKDNLMFVNISHLFADELIEDSENADVVIVPDAPMHRPNFYHHPSGSPWSWLRVEHGSGTNGQTLSQKQLTEIATLGAHPHICIFPIMPEAFALDTTILYVEDNQCQLHDFIFEIYDEAGTKCLEDNVHCEFGQRINIMTWIGERSLSLNLGGLLKISPEKTSPMFPRSFSFLQGIQQRANPTLFSTVICGGGALNLPFEWERSSTWSHPALPITHTEQFGRAVVNDDFDTIVTLMNASAMHKYNSFADLEFCVYAADGRTALFHKVIAPNSSITFSMAKLIRDSDLPRNGCFTLWIYCRNRFVQGFHILQRRRDGAVGAQHFYYCRFNICERDLEIGKEFTRYMKRWTARGALAKGKKISRMLKGLL